MSIRIAFEWIADPPPPPERRSVDVYTELTMASLCIEAGDRCFTAGAIHPDGKYRRHVETPLLGVAEWLTAFWWHLLYEVADTGPQAAEFEERHNLAHAGDGFALPSLSFLPSSDRVRLRLTPSKPKHARIEYIDPAEAVVDRTELEAEFRKLIEAVLERLDACGLEEDYLREEWAAIQALTDDEREFCRAAALYGADPFDVSDETADEIQAFWNRAAPSVREDALACAGGDSLGPVADWLESAFAALPAGPDGGDWAGLRANAASVSTGEEPWRRGYDLARAARAELGAPAGRFEFPAGGPTEVVHRAAPAPRIQGLVAADGPACVMTPRPETGRRFLLARALGDYLGRREAGPALLSSLSTDRQALSRAFAAEFLAPADSLRGRLGGDLVWGETIDELAAEFGVSSQVIRHQIDNHGLAPAA